VREACACLVRVEVGVQQVEQAKSRPLGRLVSDQDRIDSQNISD
jgi:hypothetical protein